MLGTFGQVFAFLNLGPELPTPVGAANLVLVTLAAFALALVTSEARRWSWAWLSIGATALALPAPMAVVGVVAMGLTLVARWRHRRSQALGLAVGLASFVAIIGAPTRGPTGLNTAVALVLVAPVMTSAYRLWSPGGRRRLRRVGAVVGVGVVACSAMAFVGLRSAIQASERSYDSMRVAADELEAGDRAAAARHLDATSDQLRSARQSLTAWWMAPARTLPLLGHHIDVLDGVTADGAAMADTAAGIVGAPGWVLDEGAVDLAVVEDLAAELETVTAQLAATRSELESPRSPWVAPQVTSRLDDLAAAIGRLEPDAQRSAALAQVLPGLLGADEPRRYVALFGTPAEARELGGLVATAIEFRTENGRVEVVRGLSNGELNDQLSAALAEPTRYPPTFLDARPEAVSQNWSSTPDFPTVAAAVADLFPGRTRLSGVLYLDPYAVAALLELTGPVRLSSVDLTLDAEHVVSFLLRGQYEQFPMQAERKDLLTDLGVTAFRRLLGTGGLDPGRLAAVLGPVVEEGRLLAWTFDADEQAVFADLGMDGSYPTAEGGDLLGVGLVNIGSNKLDAYLHREVRYEVAVDPVSGALEAEVVISLTNRAPAQLPRYILGLQPSVYPDGTNVADVVVRTPHDAVTATVGGRPANVVSVDELAGHRHAVRVVVERGATVEVRLRLTGSVDLTDGYRLRLVAQPLVNPDLVYVTLRPMTQASGIVVDWANLPSDQGFRLRHDLTLRAALTTER